MEDSKSWKAESLETLKSVWDTYIPLRIKKRLTKITPVNALRYHATFHIHNIINRLINYRELLSAAVKRFAPRNDNSESMIHRMYIFLGKINIYIESKRKYDKLP